MGIFQKAKDEANHAADRAKNTGKDPAHQARPPAGTDEGQLPDAQAPAKAPAQTDPSRRIGPDLEAAMKQDHSEFDNGPRSQVADKPFQLNPETMLPEPRDGEPAQEDTELDDLAGEKMQPQPTVAAGPPKPEHR
ncbi:hypothetical protein [Glutamicibacter sp. NPDC087344]|uniref:hypothetical protein n=1 Tax=Glutamicibacter sp. NPDC087344 TaxID=3363994 RepID=UPI003816D9EB